LVNLASYGGCIDPVTRGQRGFLVLKETPAVQTLLSEMKAFPYRPGKKVKVAHNRLKLNSTTRTRHGPDTDRTRTKSSHVVEYELNSTTRTRTRIRHGPDTDRTRTKSAHVVGYELNSTTRTRTDFVGDPRRPARTQRSFAAKKSVRVRAGPVGSVSGPCSGI